MVGYGTRGLLFVFVRWIVFVCFGSRCGGVIDGLVLLIGLNELCDDPVCMIVWVVRAVCAP